MKASLKFRDDQKPLFRAKVPLSVLGYPFQSGIEAGDSKEFSLNLSTFFESGPSFKFSYRPNDSFNPFSIIVKTGIGSFGSPISAPMSMSAEFNLLGGGTGGSSGNPSFFLHFKPKFGDFSIKKSTTSSSLLPKTQSLSGLVQPKVVKVSPTNPNDLDSDTEDHQIDGNGGVEVSIDNGVYQNLNEGLFIGKKFNGYNAVNTIDKVLFNGVEMNATTILPVRNQAVVKFRWGVRFPSELKNSFMEVNGVKNQVSAISSSSSSVRKIPFLVMSKISFEHLTESMKSKDSSKTKRSDNLGENTDLAAILLAVKRDLGDLQVENGLLRKATEELRSEIGSGNFGLIGGSQVSGKSRDGKKYMLGKNGFAGKKVGEDGGSEELKKVGSP